MYVERDVTHVRDCTHRDGGDEETPRDRACRPRSHPKAVPALVEEADRSRAPAALPTGARSSGLVHRNPGLLPAHAERRQPHLQQRRSTPLPQRLGGLEARGKRSSHSRSRGCRSALEVGGPQVAARLGGYPQPPGGLHATTNMGDVSPTQTGDGCASGLFIPRVRTGGPGATSPGLSAGRSRRGTGAEGGWSGRLDATEIRGPTTPCYGESPERSGRSAPSRLTVAALSSPSSRARGS
jgi:hypothetical protein